jgi:hypothetical protein
MSAAESGVAFAGAPPGHIPRMGTFDWVVGDPFQHESEYTPAAHRVPRIDGSTPIFVDNKSGMASTAPRESRDACPRCRGPSQDGRHR